MRTKNIASYVEKLLERDVPVIDDIRYIENSLNNVERGILDRLLCSKKLSTNIQPINIGKIHTAVRVPINEVKTALENLIKMGLVIPTPLPDSEKVQSTTTPYSKYAIQFDYFVLVTKLKKDIHTKTTKKRINSNG